MSVTDDGPCVGSIMRQIHNDITRTSETLDRIYERIGYMKAAPALELLNGGRRPSAPRRKRRPKLYAVE